MKYKILAIDLDGTLIYSSNYPYINSVNIQAIAVLCKFQCIGGQVIAWTCRTGEALDLAIDILGEYGLRFDAINKNTKEGRFSSSFSPKVFADMYIDNRAFPANIVGLDWKMVEKELFRE